jgi:geranylgeranyl diphosphate synthase type I
VWGRSEATGKPVASDLRQRKSSLPVVYALAADRPVAAELRRLLTRAGPPDEAGLARAVALLEACGAEQRTRDEADRQLAGARTRLERAPIEPAARQELIEIADFVVEREF